MKPAKKRPINPFGGPRSLGLSSIVHSAGVRVSATSAENSVDTATVSANCLYSCPVTPGTNAIGMNTADSTSAIATTGPDTSSIALRVASLGGSFSCSMMCSTASTTTIASSTTMPIASTMPNSDSVLIEKPRNW